MSTDPESRQPVRTILRDGVEYIILGTAHVSRSSAEEVRRRIDDGDFDAVAVELCEARYHSITGDRRWKEMDLFKVLREGKAGLVMASLALGAYQRRLADQFGIEPGAEMLAAISACESRGVELQLIDRDLNITLKRVYRAVPFWRRLVIFSGLLGSMFSKEEITEAEIESLKQGDLLESTFNEFASQSPEIYQSLISERDEYMAARLRLQNPADRNQRPRKVLAVIGAGHLAGLSEFLQQDSRDASERVTELDSLPSPARWPKLIPWLITALVLTGFAIGFSREPELGWRLVGIWVLINGSLSALGTAIARGHPLTILSAFVAAPLTSLNPAVGAGMVTGLVEAWLRKPTVADFERLRKDVTHIKGWFKNHATRILLVFFFANLGSALGTWIAGYQIFTALN